MKTVKAVAFYLAAFLIFFIFSFQIPYDPDLGINIGVGNYILDHRVFPRTDLFSFTVPDHDYAYHSWLSQAIIAAIYRDNIFPAQWGMNGLWRLSLVWSLIGSGGIFLLFRRSKPSFYSFLLFAVSSSVVFSSIGVRPQMFSFVFGIMLYTMLDRWRKRSGRVTDTLAYAFMFFCLFAAWSNFHLGYIAGLASTVIFLAAEGVLSLWQEDSPAFRKLGRLAALVSASFLGTLVGPYGLKLYPKAADIIFNPYDSEYNLEWMPLLSRGTIHLVFVVFCLLLFVVLVRKKSTDKVLLLSSFVLFVFSLRSARLVMVFLTFFLPLASAYVANFPDPLSYFKRIQEASLPLLLPCVALLLVFPWKIWSNLERFQTLLAGEMTFSRQYGYPVEAVAHLATLPQGNILNDFNWGGYILWRLPNRKVFISGMMDSYKQDGRYFVERYFSLVNAGTGWENMMLDYRINEVLLPPGFPLVKKLKQDKSWRVIYEDEGSVLLANSSSKINPVR